VATKHGEDDARLTRIELARSAGVDRSGNLEASFPDPFRATGRTHADLAADLGIDPPLLGRIRLAAGFAAQEPNDLVQSDEERILRLIVELGGSFDGMEVATRIARIFGERTQSIASAALAIYDEMVTQPYIESGVLLDQEEDRRSSEAGRRLMDQAEELLLALYRRHIESGLVSDWAQAAESLMARHGVVATRPRKPAGIAFVDLSGFTRLTEQEGDEVAVALADRLVATAETTAAAHGARNVKLLGDGVMLHGDDPTALTKAAVELVRALPNKGLPPAHAGVHAGPVIERDGDFFGRTVNVAAPHRRQGWARRGLRQRVGAGRRAIGATTDGASDTGIARRSRATAVVPRRTSLTGCLGQAPSTANRGYQTRHRRGWSGEYKCRWARPSRCSTSARAGHRDMMVRRPVRLSCPPILPARTYRGERCGS
jgi:adenylate cyclase